jgi:hypothetical protein
MKNKAVNKDFGDSRWLRQKVELMKTGRLRRQIVGYQEGRRKPCKMKEYPDMFMKTSPIQI